MSKDQWLEVSLTVDGELAEPVAEVLARFIPEGVVIESTAVSTDDGGLPGRATGPLRVFGYLAMDDQLEETRRRLEESLWYLGRIRPLPPPQFRPIQEIDWSTAWKQHYHPVDIGQRLVVVPAWLESPSPDRIAIHIDPGIAFGTGTHPTTQMCLALIETVISARSDQTHLPDLKVIDIGCGSGILSIAALKLGVKRALGVDIDADAVNAARCNAEANGVAERLELGLGSAAEVHAGTFSLRQADIVLANILAPVLVRLLNQGFSNLLLPEGALILSGILEEQSKEVESAISQSGLYLVERRQQGDWVALWAAIQSSKQ